MQNIRIDVAKGVEDGRTSVSPSNPTNSNMGSPPVSRKQAILSLYGFMLGQQVYTTAVQEIAAGGNEELATAMSNVATGVGIGVMAYATGGLSLIPQAISTGAQTYARVKSNQRENRRREMERSLKGSRVNYLNSGG